MADTSTEDADTTRRARALGRRTRRRARAIVSVGVFAAAAVVVWLLPMRRQSVAHVTVQTRSAEPVTRRDTLRRGDGVVAVLMKAGLSRADAIGVLKASQLRATARRTIPVSIFADSAAAEIREVELQLADDRSLRIQRTGESSWTAVERRELWRTDTVTVRAAVLGSLVESLRDGGRGAISVRGRLEMAYAVAEAFEYKLDVGSDLERGDSVVAVMERHRTAFGAERVGPLLAGALLHEGRWLRAIRFSTRSGSGEYYDVEGRPMRTMFLAAPLEFRRMSSVFGMRMHPLLGISRRHDGIDYTAQLGTPVRTVGDGAVIKAAYDGGYGRVIEIRHRDGMVTRYGHLRGFAKSLRAGQVVTQGQVIGFVGSTGLSTGPHLHFETLVNGVSREPTRTLRNASGVVLNGPALAAFAGARDALAARLGLAAPQPAAALQGGGRAPAGPTSPLDATRPGKSVDDTK